MCNSKIAVSDKIQRSSDILSPIFDHFMTNIMCIDLMAQWLPCPHHFQLSDDTQNAIINLGNFRNLPATGIYFFHWRSFFGLLFDLFLRAELSNRSICISHVSEFAANKFTALKNRIHVWNGICRGNWRENKWKAAKVKSRTDVTNNKLWLAATRFSSRDCQLWVTANAIFHLRPIKLFFYRFSASEFSHSERQIQLILTVQRWTS